MQQSKANARAVEANTATTFILSFMATLFIASRDPRKYNNILEINDSHPIPTTCFATGT